MTIIVRCSVPGAPQFIPTGGLWCCLGVTTKPRKFRDGGWIFAFDEAVKLIVGDGCNLQGLIHFVSRHARCLAGLAHRALLRPARTAKPVCASGRVFHAAAPRSVPNPAPFTVLSVAAAGVARSCPQWVYLVLGELLLFWPVASSARPVFLCQGPGGGLDKSENSAAFPTALFWSVGQPKPMNWQDLCTPAATASLSPT